MIAPNPLAALYRCVISHPKCSPLYVDASLVMILEISLFLSKYTCAESRFSDSMNLSKAALYISLRESSSLYLSDA